MMKKTKTIKYFLYARKSTEEEDRQATSINDQIREMKKLADINGLQIVDIFEESMSAKNIGRPIFNEMIGRINKSEATGILCWKADRLARNMVDGGNIINMLQNGVIEHIQAIDSEYRPEDNVIVLSVAFSCSTQYSKDLSINVKRGMTAKARRGWFPNKPPLGYQNGRSDNQQERNIIVPDDNFFLVKKMFNLMLKKQLSVYELAEKVYKMGLRTNAGKKLHVSSIYQMLKNPFYYGKFEWPVGSGEWHHGKHKTIITAEEFNKIQKVITRKLKNGFKRRNITYRGVMKCKVCGGMITASKITKKQQNGNVHEYVYYHCGKKVDKTCTQKSLPVNEAKLEEQIFETIDKLDIPEDLSKWAIEEIMEENKDENMVKEKAIALHEKNLQKEQDKVERYIEMRASGEITKEEFMKKRKEAELNKDYYASLLSKTKKEKNGFEKKLNETFDIVTGLKEKFENKALRKDLLLNLGSNLSLKHKKLCIAIHFRLKPFEKYGQGAKEEFDRVKPLLLSQDKTKQPLSGTACFTRWTH